nr:hypothetical protein [uncultured Campylobacter sp.]
MRAPEAEQNSQCAQKQTSNGTCAKYRIPCRIQNDARDTTSTDAQNSKAATLHPRR